MDDNMYTWELKEILAKHKDSEEVNIGLNFFDRNGQYTTHPSYVSALESKLSKAHYLLEHCQDAIDYFVKKEKKEKSILTYYEGTKGFNEGYKALKKDVDYFVDTYSKDMLRLQIENG